jgi:hypothetical protein
MSLRAFISFLGTSVLGTSLSPEDLTQAFTQLGFNYYQPKLDQGEYGSVDTIDYFFYFSSQSDLLKQYFFNSNKIITINKDNIALVINYLSNFNAFIPSVCFKIHVDSIPSNQLQILTSFTTNFILSGSDEAMKSSSFLIPSTKEIILEEYCYHYDQFNSDYLLHYPNIKYQINFRVFDNISSYSEPKRLSMETNQNFPKIKIASGSIDAYSIADIIEQCDDDVPYDLLFKCLLIETRYPQKLPETTKAIAVYKGHDLSGFKNLEKLIVSTNEYAWKEKFGDSVKHWQMNFEELPNIPNSTIQSITFIRDRLKSEFIYLTHLPVYEAANKLVVIGRTNSRERYVEVNLPGEISGNISYIELIGDIKIVNTVIINVPVIYLAFDGNIIDSLYNIRFSDKVKKLTISIRSDRDDKYRKFLEKILSQHQVELIDTIGIDNEVTGKYERLEVDPRTARYSKK